MAATLAKQYGGAMPGTSGTPGPSNRYVTDQDPRLATAEDAAAGVASLSEEAVTVADLLLTVRWLHKRLALLEAVNGTDGAIDMPAEAARFL